MWNKWIEFLQNSITSQQDADWMMQVLIVVLITMFASFLTGFLLRRLETKLHKTENLWDDAFIYALRKPLRAVIWIIGIGFAAQVIHNTTGSEIFSSVPRISEILFIVVIGWTLLRFTRKGTRTIIAQKTKRGEDVDLTTVDAISNLLRVSIFITTGLIMMQAMGYSINAVLTFGGVGGVAVGFAAKDLLANFFGALMIYLDRPFNIGDWILSPDREIEGTVEKIGWRMTTIRTFDKRPLYVPNSVFTQVAVENPSRMTHRRIYETIGIRYDDISNMQAITDDVRKMLIDHKEIDDSQTMIVQFNAFSPSSCDFFIYTFTHTTDWIKFHEIKQDVLLKLAEIIAANKSEMAFPTQTLHISEIEKI